MAIRSITVYECDFCKETVEDKDITTMPDWEEITVSVNFHRPSKVGDTRLYQRIVHACQNCTMLSSLEIFRGNRPHEYDDRQVYFQLSDGEMLDLEREPF